MSPERPAIHLHDKVAIVTGASRGIGEAIARTFASSGARVVLAARKLEALTGVAEAIVAAGGEALPVACHTGDPRQLEALLEQAVARFGQVDVLVNNAATNPYFGPMLGVDWAAWDKTFEVNVKGYFHAARLVAQHLMARGAPGSIVNVSSVVGQRGSRLQGVYAMTKAAVISMTQTLAAELGPANIRVNAIAPGFVRTRFSRALVDDAELAAKLAARTPLGRVGRPEEIAPLALYLASDAASFTTGATFVADGGLTID
jgi:NAD(P)-dependent dehydrogenase (short-subunit alcohol dehydrogenase family)